MTNHTKNNKLFTVTFNPFSVTLLQPLSVTTDPYTPKRELKKILVEIRDTVSGPLILSWSGGFDSAFAVLCYLDLIDEGKLTKDSYSISGARFTDGTEKSANIDFARGERFLEYLNIDSYGIKVDLQEVIIDADFLKEVCQCLYRKWISIDRICSTGSMEKQSRRMCNISYGTCAI